MTGKERQLWERAIRETEYRLEYAREYAPTRVPEWEQILAELRADFELRSERLRSGRLHS